MSRENAIAKALNMLRGLDEVVAVGLSGSSARGNDDAMSDLDIAVFASDHIPNPGRRRQRYASCGVLETSYFDVDFDVSRGDGLTLDGVDCSFVWMGLPATKRFMQALTTDYDCDEFLPGGLMTMRPLFDPVSTISSLKASLPSYPEARAKHRIRKHVAGAHFSIYRLGWMPKAALRNDWFSFLKSEHEVLDDFFAALFALNRRWYSEEKRLTEIADGFQTAPAGVGRRIESVVMRRGTCVSLEGGLQEVKRLFLDLALLATETHPGLDVPTDWR